MRYYCVQLNALEKIAQTESRSGAFASLTPDATVRSLCCALSVPINTSHRTKNTNKWHILTKKMQFNILMNFMYIQIAFMIFSFYSLQEVQSDKNVDQAIKDHNV